VDAFDSTAAASCPPHYGYAPTVFRGPAALAADTVYVIGGLYGNVEALHEILRMRDLEARAGRAVALVFNGDHHWFDIDPASFREIDDAVLGHTAIRGNVETEIAAPSAGGCGCNYPQSVDPAIVARSDVMMLRLQATAADFPAIRAALGALPPYCTIAVGTERIGIVHGDAHSLAGWSYAAERLSSLPERDTSAAPMARCVALQEIENDFRAAGVRAFASTHTCLPYARDVEIEGSRRLIMNNGAAGMANFAGTTHGVITRISIDPHVPSHSLYGIRLGGVRFDALPVHFDHQRWVMRFLAQWPPESVAYLSYYDRIVRGPAFRLSHAVGGRVERYDIA